jgi:hypothetical protein
LELHEAVTILAKVVDLNTLPSRLHPFPATDGEESWRPVTN